MNWGSVAAGIGAGLLTGNPAVGLGVYGAVNNAQSADAAVQAQNNANADNIAMQRETNSQEIELANTAHQREVADLKAAGLNPILSAKLGGSATPVLQSPSMQSLAPVIQNSAKQTNDVVSSDIAFAQQAKLLSSQASLNSALEVKARADANASNTSALGSALDNARKEANLPADVKAAANREWEENTRRNRWSWIKGGGLNLKDTADAALGWFGAGAKYAK